MSGCECPIDSDWKQVHNGNCRWRINASDVVDGKEHAALKGELAAVTKESLRVIAVLKADRDGNNLLHKELAAATREGEELARRFKVGSAGFPIEAISTAESIKSAADAQMKAVVERIARTGGSPDVFPAQPLLDELAKVKAERDSLRKELVSERASSNIRSEMVFRDISARTENWHRKTEALQEEVYFLTRELRRHDPRLVEARERTKR